MAFISSFTNPLSNATTRNPESNSKCKISSKSHIRMTERRLSTQEKTEKLRDLLAAPDILLMPCCYDALSAKLVQRAEFPITFLSGFSTAASHGVADTGLLTPTEMAQTINLATSCINIPLIADADTGFGNPMNIHRTLNSYFRAGASGILIEDQVNPKRCGHVKGKAVVEREEALLRVRAACDARDEFDVVKPIVIARTDAGYIDYEEAIERACLFHEIGADITFIEAPQSIDQMKKYCSSVPGLKLANMLEMGSTPILSPKQLKSIGYNVVAYPLTLLSASIKAQELALNALKNGNPDDVQHLLKSFESLKEIVGFSDYYEMEDRYK